MSVYKIPWKKLKAQSAEQKYKQMQIENRMAFGHEIVYKNRIWYVFKRVLTLVTI